MSYRGRVLLEMETVLGERPIKPVEDILHEDVLRVQVLYTFEHCLLVKLLLNTSVIMLCFVVIIVDIYFFACFENTFTGFCLNVKIDKQTNKQTIQCVNSKIFMLFL